MRYSRYVLLPGILGGMVFLVFASLFLAVGGAAAVGFVVFLGIVVGISFGLRVAWAHRAVEDYDGSPFQGSSGYSVSTSCRTMPTTTARTR